MKIRYPDHQDYPFGNRTVVYYHKALKEGNNLDIFEGEECVWKLGDLFFDDAVVQLDRSGEDSIRFITWNGIIIEFNVATLEVIKKDFTK